MKEVDFFPIHGISKEVDASHYYDGFVNGIRKYLPIDFDLRIHPVDHSHLLKDKEETIFSWFKDDWYQAARKFICNYACDVIALSPSEVEMEGNFYYDVLKMIEREYDAVMKDHPMSKKVIFGHSLGSEIGLIFSFKKEVDWLLTCGSPIDYFAIRFPKFGKFPEATLHNWLNFHYKQDLVSGMVTKNPNFKRSNVKDMVLPIYNPLYFLPVRAHCRYWNDDRVHIKIANILKAL